MTTHNGYKTLSEPSTLAQLHPSTARIAADEDGLLPDWVIYHELVSTAKVFLSRVSLTAKYTAHLIRHDSCSAPQQTQLLLCTSADILAALQLEWLYSGSASVVHCGFHAELLVAKRDLAVWSYSKGISMAQGIAHAFRHIPECIFPEHAIFVG